MWPMIFVAAGGAAGSVARYSMGRYVLRYMGAGFPWGTLAVNIVGSFAIGLCMHYLPRDASLRLLIITGFLGGFTTFSAFSMEALTLLKAHPLHAVLYILLSVLGSLAAVFLGAKMHV